MPRSSMAAGATAELSTAIVQHVGGPGNGKQRDNSLRKIEYVVELVESKRFRNRRKKEYKPGGGLLPPCNGRLATALAGDNRSPTCRTSPSTPNKSSHRIDFCPFQLRR